ncbi:hypothetical protein ZWY2020_031998 [Hordeum vulgare]|nr:hypothetical protein ZWY2020_031998 [Hordeum vulgare]
MSTLMEVQGRHSCRAVEASCIEYMASDPAVYAAVKATDDYKELKESCCSFLLEVAEKVAAVNMVHNMCCNAPSSSVSRLQTDASTLTSLEAHTSLKFRVFSLCKGDMELAKKSVRKLSRSVVTVGR